jgi:hypothetical protein
VRDGDDSGASRGARRLITALAIVALVLLGAGMAFGQSAFQSRTGGRSGCPYERYWGHDNYCLMPIASCVHGLTADYIGDGAPAIQGDYYCPRDY